eukprot:4102371-Prymnesium_polylepis.1
MSGERSPKPATTRPPQGGDQYLVLACGALEFGMGFGGFSKLFLGFLGLFLFLCLGFWLSYPSVEVPLRRSGSVPPPKR